jgi:hypothetical protein
MMEASAGSDKPKRGEIGRQTFEAVQALVRQGNRTTEAFAKVAEKTGRSAATVATAYYRVARTLPDAGGVKLRPRSGPKARPRAATTARRGGRRAASGNRSTQAMVRDLVQAAEALGRHVENLESELAKARGDLASYAQIQRLVRDR